MNQEHTIGIDIGSNSIKVVVAESHGAGSVPKILHATESSARGFRHGYVTDIEKASQSLSRALAKAEKEYKQKITRARFSIGGIGLCSQYVRTAIDIESKHNEISERHIDEVLQKAEDLFIAKYPNKKILHIVPVKYRVNERDVLGNPIGMYGNAIEVKVIFITILEHHYEALVHIINHNKIGILDIIASPIADAAASTTEKQKIQGCVLANIGAETTSIATFENGIITSLDVINIGSNDVTNDIALGLQISLEEAEQVKVNDKHDHPKRLVDDIMSARVADILELLGKHLEKIKKNRLLPAGIIFTGGGAPIQNLTDYARTELKIPASRVLLQMTSKKTRRTVTIPESFSVAYGLCITQHGHQRFTRPTFSFTGITHFLKNIVQQIMP
ncbi:cell division protein FtsA [Patescibacteria group bacterium]|nr:cell division protein FtsA [Patescibacteria group bacterium]